MAAKDKSLKDKAIDIKGKKYVLVSDRVIYFNEEYTNGFIETTYSMQAGDTYEFKAIVTPDVDNPRRVFTGHSQATIGDGMVNKTAAMENAETSAVGRALAMMGIGVLDSIASVDEINKATGSTGKRPMRFASPKSIDWIRQTAEKYVPIDMDTDDWIKGVLTLLPEQIPQYKVKDAVDKIDEFGMQLSKQKQTELDEVITDLPDTINLDDIPY